MAEVDGNQKMNDFPPHVRMWQGCAMWKDVVMGVVQREADGFYARILGGYDAGPFSTIREAVLDLCRVNEVPNE